jgi:hypothetical protein
MRDSDETSFCFASRTRFNIKGMNEGAGREWDGKFIHFGYTIPE